MIKLEDCLLPLEMGETPEIEGLVRMEFEPDDFTVWMDQSGLDSIVSSKEQVYFLKDGLPSDFYERLPLLEVVGPGYKVCDVCALPGRTTNSGGES